MERRATQHFFVRFWNNAKTKKFSPN